MQALPDDASDLCKEAFNRLNRNCEVNEETGCCLWTGRTDQGKGVVKFKGTGYKVHRLAYQMYNNMEIKKKNIKDEKLIVGHVKCENLLCMCYGHLALLTYKEFGQIFKTTSSFKQGKLKMAKITEETAKNIIASARPKGHADHKTHAQIAKDNNTTEHTVCAILIGQNWQDLPRPSTLPAVKGDNKRERIVRLEDWDVKRMEEVWNRVKKLCIYDEEPNKFAKTPCFIWQRKNPMMRAFNRHQSPYIFALEFKNKKIKVEGEEVRHFCRRGRDLCCAPDHLRFGSKPENGEDKVTHAESKSFKLTHEQVDEIRYRYKNEKYSTQKSLALAFNVGESTIGNIVTYISWKKPKLTEGDIASSKREGYENESEEEISENSTNISNPNSNSSTQIEVEEDEESNDDIEVDEEISDPNDQGYISIDY